jgi:hypothetical protein
VSALPSSKGLRPPATLLGAPWQKSKFPDLAAGRINTRRYFLSAEIGLVILAEDALGKRFNSRGRERSDQDRARAKRAAAAAAPIIASQLLAL